MNYLEELYVDKYNLSFNTEWLVKEQTNVLPLLILQSYFIL